MIELNFQDFHEQKYRKKNYCLYMMQNGSGNTLYVGISTVDVWDRWFDDMGDEVFNKKN